MFYSCLESLDDVSNNRQKQKLELKYITKSYAPYTFLTSRHFPRRCSGSFSLSLKETQLATREVTKLKSSLSKLWRYTYIWQVEVKIHSFLTSTLNGCQASSSCPNAITPKTAWLPGPNCTGGSASRKTVLQVLEKEESLIPNVQVIYFIKHHTFLYMRTA
jgi:hypothetical protein